MSRPYVQHSSQAIIDLCKRSIYQKDTLFALKEEVSLRRERFVRTPKELIDFAISLHEQLISASKNQDHSQPDKLTISEAYEILGVPCGSNLETIGSARRQLLQQYHPDKVASMAEKFQLLAESETKNINMAYSLIVRHHKSN